MKKMMLSVVVASLLTSVSYADETDVKAKAGAASIKSSAVDSSLSKGLGMAGDKVTSSINSVGSSDGASAGSLRNIPTDGSVKSDAGSVTAIGIVGGDAENTAKNGGKASMDIGANSNVNAGKDVTAIGIVGGDAKNSATGTNSKASMGIGKNDGVGANGNVTAIGIVGTDATNTADKGATALMGIGQNTNVKAGRDVTAIGIVGQKASNSATEGAKSAVMSIGENNNVSAGKDVTAIGIVGGSATNEASGQGSEVSMRIGANGMSQ